MYTGWYNSISVRHTNRCAALRLGQHRDISGAVTRPGASFLLSFQQLHVSIGCSHKSLCGHWYGCLNRAKVRTAVPPTNPPTVLLVHQRRGHPAGCFVSLVLSTATHQYLVIKQVLVRSLIRMPKLCEGSDGGPAYDPSNGCTRTSTKRNPAAPVEYARFLYIIATCHVRRWKSWRILLLSSRR